MIVPLSPLISIGDGRSCVGWKGPVVHALKFPCYWNAVGGVQPKPDDHYYLARWSGPNLFMNLVDADSSYFRVDLMQTALDFISQRVGQGDVPVLVHCNQGLSRSPSIAMLWMAKRNGINPPAVSYEQAVHLFRRIYPAYKPSAGISSFLVQKWDEIV